MSPRHRSRRSASSPAGAWRIAADVRSLAAPEFTYFESFAQRVGFDEAALMVAASVYQTWVLQGSDPELVQVILHEQTVLQGPHADVLASGLPTKVDRMDDTSARWPLLTACRGLSSPALLDLLVVPLGYSPQVAPIGTLSISRDGGPRFSPSEIEEVTGFARLIGGMLLDRWQAVRDVDLLDALIHDQRNLAAGVLASYLGVSPEQAMSIMRARAFREGMTLSDFASGVVRYLGMSVP